MAGNDKVSNDHFYIILILEFYIHLAITSLEILKITKSFKITSNIFWDSTLLIPSSFAITSIIRTSLIVQGVWDPRMSNDRGTLQFLGTDKPSQKPIAMSLPGFSTVIHEVSIMSKYILIFFREINIVELAHKKEWPSFSMTHLHLLYLGPQQIWQVSV